MSIIIDGRKIANDLCKKLSQKVDNLKDKYNIFPCLKVILVGDNPVSKVYVYNKQKRAESVGISSETIILPSNTSEDELITKISELNEDLFVHGILVQLPLPRHIEVSRVLNSIKVEKDVDGFHDENVGRLIKGEKNCFIPCTPSGSLHLIKLVESNLSGKNAVVIGRSNIVGKPMFHLLLQENCTVTVLHSKSKDLVEHSSKADILVVAVGKSNFIKKDWVKDGAIVIDVGININDRGFTGDVDFNAVREKVKAITPVPGGVGPMTVVFLMKNTFIATCIQNKISVFNFRW
ncbi:MAG: bifunctional methylenetetrahydrofolate dehydrogenase/methenyltetrahydrofolate cyclohydrolase FolD [Wolbachia endosymbiont of Menacanthus eurysternus]|nr:MAG: bifunctional methylenetetrahydrofolate dehydrogenase/methenyltetrahydrofolate cyclohydrolase FolD [Wolbachia endosymbiont of Menacanthus eurysternus]